MWTSTSDGPRGHAGSRTCTIRVPLTHGPAYVPEPMDFTTKTYKVHQNYDSVDEWV